MSKYTFNLYLMSVCFDGSMPIYKTKNENFFKIWSSDMAYVLGFFVADGSMWTTKRNTHFIEFQITDKDLLERIRELLGSNHKIAARDRNPKWKTAYRLQIGCKILFNDLEALGMMQNKSNVVNMPNIPSEYFPDFLRGYFDGDGNIALGNFNRADCNSPQRVFSVRFTSGSRLLLEGIRARLSKTLGVTGSLFWSSGWRLNYSAFASRKLFDFMYNGGTVAGLIYLERKYKIFQDAFAIRVSLRP